MEIDEWAPPSLRGKAEQEIEEARVPCTGRRRYIWLAWWLASRQPPECRFSNICKCCLMMLTEAIETSRSLKEARNPTDSFSLQLLAGEGLTAASHSPSCWARALEEGPVVDYGPQLPNHPALSWFSAPSPTMLLASDRNRKLSGLGINCLNAFVQDSFPHQLSEVLFEIHGSPLWAAL